MATFQRIEQGEVYWCEPDPQDTVGSEQEKDRPWVIVSQSYLHRGNCVVGIPISKQLDKAVAHLIQIPKDEFTPEPGVQAYTGVALTDQIRALDKSRFRKKFGRISTRALNSLIHLGIRRMLGISAIPPSDYPKSN